MCLASSIVARHDTLNWNPGSTSGDLPATFTTHFSSHLIALNVIKRSTDKTGKLKASLCFYERHVQSGLLHGVTFKRVSHLEISEVDLVWIQLLIIESG